MKTTSTTTTTAVPRLVQPHTAEEFRIWCTTAVCCTAVKELYEYCCTACCNTKINLLCCSMWYITASPNAAVSKEGKWVLLLLSAVVLVPRNAVEKITRDFRCERHYTYLTKYHVQQDFVYYCCTSNSGTDEEWRGSVPSTPYTDVRRYSSI